MDKNERYSCATCIVLLFTLIFGCTGCVTNEIDLVEEERLNERLAYPLSSTVPVYIKRF